MQSKSLYTSFSWISITSPHGHRCSRYILDQISRKAIGWSSPDSTPSGFPSSANKVEWCHYFHRNNKTFFSLYMYGKNKICITTKLYNTIKIQLHTINLILLTYMHEIFFVFLKYYYFIIIVIIGAITSKSNYLEEMHYVTNAK